MFILNMYYLNIFSIPSELGKYDITFHRHSRRTLNYSKRIRAVLLIAALDAAYTNLPPKPAHS